jgi:hypothetical protein
VFFDCTGRATSHDELTALAEDPASTSFDLHLDPVVHDRRLGKASRETPPSSAPCATAAPTSVVVG